MLHQPTQIVQRYFYAVMLIQHYLVAHGNCFTVVSNMATKTVTVWWAGFGVPGLIHSLMWTEIVFVLKCCFKNVVLWT